MNVIPQRVKDAGVALIAPLARASIQGGVHPNVISTLGTIVVIGSGVAFGFGEIRLGGLLLLVSGLFDILDGEVARQGGMATTFGAFYDSTLDRIGESAVFAGLALYFLHAPLPANLVGPAVGAAIAALASSLLVSYARARAEGLGVECKGGIPARADRGLLLGGPAMVFGGGSRAAGVLLFWVVVVLALLSAITVFQRVGDVSRATPGSPARPP